MAEVAPILRLRLNAQIKWSVSKHMSLYFSNSQPWKYFLNNSLENFNLQLYNPNVINLKERFCHYFEGSFFQNSLFLDAEWQYHTKVYNIILSILVSVAPKILRTNVVNVLVLGLH